jgi:hypothetical protein
MLQLRMSNTRWYGRAPQRFALFCIAGLLLPSCTDPAGPRPPVALQLEAADTVLGVNESVALMVRLIDEDGNHVETLQAVEWTVGDSSIIDISDDIATGKGPGITEVVASVSGLTDSLQLIVQIPILRISVYQPPPILGVGGSVQIPLGLMIEGAVFRHTSAENTRNRTGHSLEWQSSAPGIVAVNAEGVVTGVALGEATITVSAGYAEATVDFAVLPSLKLRALQVGGTIANARLAESGSAIWNQSGRAFLWDGELHDLGAWQVGDLNSRGDIVGCGESGAILWVRGEISTLFSSPVGSVACASAINEYGMIAGSVYNPRGGVYGSYELVIVAATGEVSRILSGFAPTAINDAGTIIGNVYARHYYPHVFQEGDVRDLSVDQRLEDLNEKGQIALTRLVGNSSTRGAYLIEDNVERQLSSTNENYHWWVNYWAGGQIFQPAVAHGLNDVGEVVITIWSSPVLWRQAKEYPLQSIHDNPDWVVERAFDVNNQGQVLAEGHRRSDGARGMLLLEPKSPTAIPWRIEAN